MKTEPSISDIKNWQFVAKVALVCGPRGEEQFLRAAIVQIVLYFDRSTRIFWFYLDAIFQLFWYFFNCFIFVMDYLVSFCEQTMSFYNVANFECIFFWISKIILLLTKLFVAVLHIKIKIFVYSNQNP